MTRETGPPLSLHMQLLGGRGEEDHTIKTLMPLKIISEFEHALVQLEKINGKKKKNSW